MKKSRYRKEDLLYNKWLNIEKSGMVTISKIKFYYERRVLEAKISQISCHIYLNKEEGCMLLNKRLPISGIRLAMECYGVLNELGKQTTGTLSSKEKACVYAHMYVYMYVCMYARMYAMYVCMYVCVCHVCMYVCVCIYMYICMYVIYVCMYVCHICVYACMPHMYICMYVCMSHMHATSGCHICMSHIY